MIPQRNLFVLVGDTLGGSIRPGMAVAILLNNAMSLDAPIDSVEVINTTEGARVSLAIRCQDREETEFYKSLNISDEEFAINDQIGI